MKLIWHGTASVELVSAAGRILFDPFVPMKHAAVPVRLTDFDGFGDVFVTHGHFDHIADLPRIVKRNEQMTIRCTETPYRTLCRKGIPEDRLALIRYGSRVEVQGFSVQVLHGRHAELPGLTMEHASYMLRSKARGNIPRLLYGYKAYPENDETVFYHIEAEGKQVSLMGSLNLREDEDYPTGADVLILPYNGWADNLPPALRVLERLKPKRVLLDHYDDTFPPLTRPIDLQPLLQASPVPVTQLRWNEAVEI